MLYDVCCLLSYVVRCLLCVVIDLCGLLFGVICLQCVDCCLLVVACSFLFVV